MLEAHLVQELEIKEAGSRGRPAVGLMVETEAGTIYLFVLAVAKFSLRYAILAANWW